MSHGTRHRSTRRREILLPASDAAATRSSDPLRDPRDLGRIDRPRTPLARRAHRRCEQPTSKASRSARGCSVRQVNMTISLAFLAPDLVKAAIEGRLPRGIGVTRLRDAPVEWSRQHSDARSDSVDRASGLRALPRCPRQERVCGRQRQRRRKRLPNPIAASPETERPHETPPIGGLFDESPEHSVRMGVRGGPGRTRTSNQTVMSGRL